MKVIQTFFVSIALLIAPCMLFGMATTKRTQIPKAPIYTTIFTASQCGDLDTVIPIIKSSAGKHLINAVNEEGYTPLMYAAHNGHYAVAQFLLDNHADPNIQSINDCKITALHAAANGGQVAIIDLLINYGALVEIPDAIGATPIMYATLFGYTTVVQSLLEKNADPCGQSTDKVSALHLAAEKGHNDIIEILLKHHIPVDLLDAEGRTPLMFAAKHGNLSTVELLLRYNANYKLIDTVPEGAIPSTALRFALYKKDTSIAHVLASRVAVAEIDPCPLCLQEKKEIAPTKQRITTCCFQLCCKSCKKKYEQIAKQRDDAVIECPFCRRLSLLPFLTVQLPATASVADTSNSMDAHASSKP